MRSSSISSISHASLCAASALALLLSFASCDLHRGDLYSEAALQSRLKSANGQDRQDAIEIAQKADHAFESGNPDEGIEFLKKSVARYPIARTYFDLGNALSGKNLNSEAIQAYQAVAFLEPDQRATAEYNIACAYARDGKKDDALLHLDLALRAGYANWKGMEKDRDLDALRATPRYLELLKKYKR